MTHFQKFIEIVKRALNFPTIRKSSVLAPRNSPPPSPKRDFSLLTPLAATRCSTEPSEPRPPARDATLPNRSRERCPHSSETRERNTRDRNWRKTRAAMRRRPGCRPSLHRCDRRARCQKEPCEPRRPPSRSGKLGSPTPDLLGRARGARRPRAALRVRSAKPD